MTTNFFSPLSFVTVFGSGIRDPSPGSGMVKNQDPGSGINIPDPQHWKIYCIIGQTNFRRDTRCRNRDGIFTCSCIIKAPTLTKDM